jgi:hypothetical protein
MRDFTSHAAAIDWNWASAPVLAGIAWPLLARIGLGRLPGDIMIQRGSTSFYFPLVTCIIVSIVLSA